MAISGSTLTAIAYAGIGTAIGAFVQSISGHRESSAHAAAMIMTANTDFAKAAAEENTRLAGETHTLRDALVRMTDAMDVVLDAMDEMLKVIPSDPIEGVARNAIAVARKANRVAKTVI